MWETELSLLYYRQKKKKKSELVFFLHLILYEFG